jgi:transcriptional regulator with XRE-family HTH domain
MGGRREMTTTMTTLTNLQFAQATGLHHTMASRLRNGERSPSISTVIATQRAFGLTCEQLVGWLAAIELGPVASGAWLREHIFDRGTAAISEAGN